MGSSRADSDEVIPITPRGEAELLDFDELDRIEAERASEGCGGVAVAEVPTCLLEPCSKKERAFRDLDELRVGERVQVLSDCDAVLKACRATGIDPTYDKQRIALLGAEVSILSKDPSDNTVKCKAPEVGQIWFSVSALGPAVKQSPGDQEGRTDGESRAEAAEEEFTWAAAWRAHMSGLSVAEDGGDEGDTEGYGAEADGRAVMMELELEAGVERRLCEGAREGKMGALITVRETDAAVPEGKCKRVFIADAMNLQVLRFTKLFSNSGEQVARTGAEGLECFVAAVVLLLCKALPLPFTSSAATHGERLVRLFQDRRKGVCHLVEELLSNGRSDSQVNFVWKLMMSTLKDIAGCLKKLLECLCSPTPEEWETMEAVHGEVERIFSTNLEYRPEEILSWHKSLARFGGGKNLITRTSLVTITQLLHELRVGFQAEDFQTRYQELRSQARHGGEAHVRMVEWTFGVQQRVLVRYGFEASPRGVWNMRAETGYHADGHGAHMAGVGEKRSCPSTLLHSKQSSRGVGDEIAAKLRRDIHVCLEMDARKSFRLPVFHTVGDSHSRFGWPACVIQHWQGPLLCYNVDRVDLRNMQPPICEGDAICLCFGEIDCRCHVHKHVTEGKTYKDVIDGIIEKYFGHLLAQVRLLPQGVRIFVYNVLPPVRKCNAELNTQFPYLGEDEERLAYVAHFNTRLRQECGRTGFRYFDVYDRYADEEGYLSEEYSDGSVHVSDGVWIDEVIRGLKLKPVWVSELRL